jgi:hypothetical protein
VAIASESEDRFQQQVDAALKEWSQGDCVLGEQWFVHRFHAQCPLTNEYLVRQETLVVKPLFFF